MDRDEFIREVEARIPRTAFAALGIRVERYDPDQLVVALEIDDRHRQMMGLLHGGVSALLAESAASLAAAMSIDPTRNSVVGVDINATHMRSRREGTVRATARPVHRGRTTHVYSIEVSDGAGQLVCLARCTLAIRPNDP